MLNNGIFHALKRAGGYAGMTMVLVALSGCGQKTLIRFEGYSMANRFAPPATQPLQDGQEPRLLAKLVERLYAPLLPQAEAAVSEVQLCFKRLRFKYAKPEDGHADDDSLRREAASSSKSNGDHIDLDLGLVTLSSAGTELAEVSVKEGEYRRIEFDLKDECGTGFALLVRNSHGTFTEDRHTKIRFDGLFHGTESELVLNAQAIIGELNDVRNANDLKKAAESAGGKF